MLPQARSALGSRSSSQYCDFNYHICSRSLFDRLVPAVFRTAGAKDVDPRIWHCFVALTAARIIATIDQPDQSPCSTRGRHELWQTLSLSSRENSTRERENLADSFVARNLAADDSKMSRTFTPMGAFSAPCAKFVPASSRGVRLIAERRLRFTTERYAFGVEIGLRGASRFSAGSPPLLHPTNWSIKAVMIQSW